MSVSPIPENDNPSNSMISLISIRKNKFPDGNEFNPKALNRRVAPLEQGPFYGVTDLPASPPTAVIKE